MKKNTIKAFTLVEMLIVIVIIGILIASLMPRMQSAQGRARDVARKNDLSQIQTAIITSQQDKRNWPGMDKTTKPTEGYEIATIETELQDAGMTQVPKDPNKSNTFKWLAAKTVASWNYWYMVTKRNAVANGWFVLMAKTEVEGSSNWLVCDVTSHTAVASTATDDAKTTELQTNWFFVEWVDLKNVQTCTKFVKDPDGECGMDAWVCTYTDEAQLRYILVY